MSMYLCLDVFCEQQARAAEVAALNESCVGSGMRALPPISIVSNYTAGDIERLRHIRLDETFAPNDTVKEVVLPASELHKAWFDTLDAIKYVKHYHFLYGSFMIMFWIVVVALGVGNRVVLGSIRFLKTYRLCRGHRSETATWMRRRILLPATFGYRCATEVWCGTIPPRMQSLTIAAFAIANLAFSMYGYKITPVNLYFPSPLRQWLRYVSDRTGIISFANFPVIWLFGMRNNFAIWLTGWDFGTYNNFHRWVARIATLQAVVHSVGYTALILYNGGWTYFASWWRRTFWVAGEVATVFMCALIACSVYWLRRQRYELFLVLHIGMSAVVLVTMLGHVSIFNGHFDAFFWIPVFLWIFDRVLRILRIVFFNPTLKPTVATATYSLSTNIVRLHVPCRFRAYKVRPGTYCYLSVIDDERFWESHPFTVASVSDSSPPGKSFGEQAPLLESGVVNAEYQETAEPDSRLLLFLIRPYDSFTSRLRDLAAKESPQPASLRVLMDGPYGHSQPLHQFDHVLFVVGGSGIVVPLSYLKVLTGCNKQTTSTHVHWATREPDFAADVLSNDVGEALGDASLAIDLYFSAETERNMGADIPPKVSRHYGRPNARAIILAAAEDAGECSLAVVACGPARMADDARRAVVQGLATFPCQMEYFEESFRW
ncbi:ferric-chelate reductase [Metarhizium album ARSEF 1941]|uniref:Ferric-chelate reductase n=1 Tax=Metarhizium album (strain ARSEF 1941) TaxID=1081103 RepID=A0A0B2WJ88_METAS|nr:ferric-chelate reductase [Metarhizium album ARSEF 1941]KHN93968.1 ferric-chelate reductase [Metarhizium album ARSEF 1941]